MKLCIIYNFAPHYRSEIFSLIDKNFDCDWYFGDSMGDVKKMDYSIIKGNISELPKFNVLNGRAYFQRGVIKLLAKDYDAFIVLSDSRSISNWIFAVASKFFPHKKVFFWSHGWYGKENKFERIIKKILYRLPNGGTFLYGHYAKDLMMNEGFKSDKLFVIHNSLAYDRQIETRKSLENTDIYSSHFGNDFQNLIFVGRLTPVKKLDKLLLALVMLKEQGKRYNLTFVGSGVMSDSLVAKTKELGLTDSVWFYGACYDEEQLGNLIYNADLCVSPGNVGLTAIHSMVFGCPVVTHDNFSLQGPEFEAIKKGETGDFFKYDSVDSLADTISNWLVSKTTQREIVRDACMKEIDDSWNPYFQLDVINKVLKG